MELQKLPYGIPNFRSISEEGYLFVDKTPYVEKLEGLGEKYLFFLRPRKFGKSLFISMLEHYYDVKHADKFERLFGNFYIGKHPTSLHNGYLVLAFDFSGIDTTSRKTTYKGFLENVRNGVRYFLSKYEKELGEIELEEVLSHEEPENLMKALLERVREKVEKKIYLLIDEYDHFANELLAFKFDMFASLTDDFVLRFRELVSRTGFVRKFYEVLKTGARDGVIDRMFITGVTPITLDSFTSGFNIGRNLSLDEEFHDMLGFTEDETRSLIEITCSHCNVDLNEIYKQISNCYNGHSFRYASHSTQGFCENKNRDGKLFNPNMVLHYLGDYQRYCKPPRILIDANIASDYRKIGNLFRLFEMKEGREIINELMGQDVVYGNLTVQFNLEREFERDDFLSLLLYMGFITVENMVGESVGFGIPNYVIKELYYNYLYEIMEQEYGLQLKVEKLRDAMRDLAYQGRVEKLIRIVEDFLRKVLSNRDLRGFQESHLKVHILTLLHLSRMFYIQSEMEAQRGYVDIFLRETPQFPVDYEWAFELKYVRKEDLKDLEQLKAEGEEQLEKYMGKVRPQARRSLKSVLLIFSGEGECIFNKEIDM